MGSSANISSRTSPPFFSTMRMRSIFYTLLLVSPACLALELQHATPQQSSVGRQFSDDEIVNYFGWGFIAGLMDYFIRQQFSATTTTTATAVKAIVETEGDVVDTEAEEEDAVIEVADAMVEQVKKVRNKKKQKKNKKNRNKNGIKKKETQKMMEIENQMEEDDLDDATVNV